VRVACVWAELKDLASSEGRGWGRGEIGEGRRRYVGPP